MSTLNRITKVDSQEDTLRTVMASKPVDWRVIAGTFDLDFGHAALTSQGGPQLGEELLYRNEISICIYPKNGVEAHQTIIFCSFPIPRGNYLLFPIRRLFVGGAADNKLQISSAVHNTL